MKHLIAAAAALTLLASANAQITTTYQGNTRWAETQFTPNVPTIRVSTSYISYFIVETRDGKVVNALKIDAWTTRRGRFYYIDNDFFMEYGFFGVGGANVAGSMEFDTFDVLIPFRGLQRLARLDSFALYPATDYYPRNSVLDVTTITGSARMNRSFSGNISLNTAANAVLDFLESRGYREF